MKDLVLITGYKEVNFTTENKENIDMVKISYLTKLNGEAIGMIPSQITFKDNEKKNILESLKSVPGLYNAEYGVVPGKNNKPQLCVVGFEFVKNIDLKSLFIEKQ